MQLQLENVHITHFITYIEIYVYIPYTVLDYEIQIENFFECQQSLFSL